MIDANGIPWASERSRGNYPLTGPLFLPGVLSDANFVQFGNTPPVLVSLLFTSETCTLVLQLDLDSTEVLINRPASYPYSQQIYLGSRYVGTLVFGYNFDQGFVSYANQLQKVNLQFCASTVTNLNPAAGLYSLNGLTGAVVLDGTNSVGDSPVFFNIADHNVQWNCLGFRDPVGSAVSLKSLNLVTPIDNRLLLTASEILRLEPYSGGIKISLANSVLNDKIMPSRSYV